MTDRLYNEVKPLVPGPRRIVLVLKELTDRDRSGIGTMVRLYVPLHVGRLCAGADECWAVSETTTRHHALLSVFPMIAENHIRMGVKAVERFQDLLETAPKA